MATLQTYQRTLLENRDSLLTEVRTDQVVPLLFVSHVLTQKEIDNIDVGRTWNERAESLLDVLHYKGERGFREFCNALEDTYPHLAAKLKASRPQVEVSESDSRQSSSGEKHIYNVPHKERTRSSEQLGGEFEKRQERESDAGSTSRSQRESQEMRGDQMSYERRPHRGSKENVQRYYDGGRFEDRGQYGGNLSLGQVENDRSSQGSSERGFRRSATELDLQPGPGEQEIMEKQTIVLEKAHAGQGFGIAVSGGRDNPHKVSGDPAIVVSDIISNSPAAGLLRTGDIICQVNDRDVENVLHATAVQALKDSGNSARLIIKRRKIVSIPKKESTPLRKEPQQITLIRDKVKGYGFSLAHQLFIKEIDEKGVAANDGGIRSGDVLVKINDKRTDELTLRSAIDLVRNSKDHLDLVVLKQDGGGPTHFSTLSLPASYRNKDKPQAIHNGYDDERVPDIPGRFYDQEDTKPARPPPPDEEPDRGMPFADSSWKRPGLSSESQDMNDRYHEEPLEVHVSDVTHATPVSEAWDHSSPITKMTTSYVESGPSTPLGSINGRKNIQYRGDARLVAFRKSGSLGIQVQGGNKVGIFVAAVKEGSAAHDRGLRKGDQILMANDIDFKDITREEAVLILLSLGDEVSLLAQHKRSAFDKISKEPGDDFYIKAHFNYEAPTSKPEELTFNKEDVFHVTDTMFNGVIGSWHAKLVDKMMNVETDSGVVPNKCRAEQLAVVEQMKEEKTPQKFSTGSLKRSSFKGGSLRKNYHFRSSDKLDMAAFDSTVREIQLPAYERVQRKHPGFVRPVVLLGPIADITRDKLLQDMPDVYAVPGGYQYGAGKSQKRSYNYRDIREIIDAGKHCLLDISPDEVERLNYAQLYPIVIFLKPPSKQMVKEMRAQYGQSNKHIKQLYDNAMKLEEFYYNVFHAKITAAVMDNWYGRVKDEISKQQQDLVWMTEDKVEDDEHEDMVFHGPGRYSQAFDNESTHYDPALDSPTILRSSDSNQPVDEDIVQVAEPVRTVQSAAPPRDERNMRQAYSEPYISYNGQDADRYDDRGRDRYDGRYDRDRDRYDGRPPYDGDDDIEKASRPGYKPSGNIVKVLPSSEEPTDLRHSLRKSLPPRDSGEWDGQYETEINRTAEGLRRSEPLQRLDQPSQLEAQVRNKRDALRKVEDDSDLLRQYDERVGVKVSDLWTIDNESRGRYDRREPTRGPDDEPAVSVAVKSRKQDDDLDKRLEQLDEVASRQPPMTKPKPISYQARPRNTIVDYRSEDRPEIVAHTTRYPTKSYATVTHYFEKDEPEVRAQTSAPVSSMPRYQDDRREYPEDQVIRVGEPEGRFGSRPSEPRQTYRAEVTIPTRRDSKPERPRSGYSSHAYAPKPFTASEVQVGQTYDFKLSRPQTDSSYSSLKRDEDRYGYGGMTDLDKLDHGKDNQQNVITSDFESLEDETQVVATARGWFTSKGGVLTSPESGVSIVIPEGAIPKGLEQEIYFKVCKDNNFMPPLDADKGETLLSPLVMCGPHGTQFLKPVELRLPHCASMTPDGWSFALKSSDTPSGDPFSNSSSPPSQWKNLSLQGQDPKLDQCKVDSSSVSVLVDHF